jgi:hypothetical protein
MMLIFSYRPLPSFALRLFVFCLKLGVQPASLLYCSAACINLGSTVYKNSTYCKRCLFPLVFLATGQKPAAYWQALFPPTKTAMALQKHKLFQLKQGLVFHRPIVQRPI